MHTSEPNKQVGSISWMMVMNLKWFSISSKASKKFHMLELIHNLIALTSVKI